jgi:hypothetical protein
VVFFLVGVEEIIVEVLRMYAKNRQYAIAGQSPSYTIFVLWIPSGPDVRFTVGFLALRRKLLGYLEKYSPVKTAPPCYIQTKNNTTDVTIFSNSIIQRKFFI